MTTHVTQSERDIKWPGTTIPILHIHRSHCRNPVQFIRTSSDGETIIIVPEPRVEDEVNAAGAFFAPTASPRTRGASENAEIAVLEQYQTAVIKNSYAVQSQSDSRRPLTHVAPRRPFASSHYGFTASSSSALPGSRLHPTRPFGHAAARNSDSLACVTLVPPRCSI